LAIGLRSDRHVAGRTRGRTTRVRRVPILPRPRALYRPASHGVARTPATIGSALSRGGAAGAPAFVQCEVSRGHRRPAADEVAA
jgi:hypothetical protein